MWVGELESSEKQGKALRQSFLRASIVVNLGLSAMMGARDAQAQT